MSQQDELQRRLTGVYSDALHKLIIDNAKTLKAYKDIDTGKVKPPSYIDTPEKLKAWKQTQLRQLFQKANLINGIVDELNKAGLKSTGYILKGLEAEYKAEHDAVTAMLSTQAQQNGINV